MSASKSEYPERPKRAKGAKSNAPQALSAHRVAYDKPCADVARRIISNATAIGSRAFKPTAMAVAMVHAAVSTKQVQS